MMTIAIVAEFKKYCKNTEESTLNLYRDIKDTTPGQMT